MKIEFEPRQISSSQLRVPIESLLQRQVRQYSVASAFSKEFEGNRQAAIKKLSKKLGMDVSKGFNQIDHNVMYKLIDNGFLQMAQEFTCRPDVFRQTHKDIFAVAGDMVREVNRNDFGTREKEEQLAGTLNALIMSRFNP